MAIQAVTLLGAILISGGLSAFVLHQDLSWDLRNYHFYNAWAFVHDRLGWDIAAAHSQTFHNPLLDLPFYWMVTADWPPRLISFVMAMPAGIGAFFVAKILLLLFRESPPAERWAYSSLAFMFGITASGPVSLLASTMNDWPPTTLQLIALWLILRRIEQDSSALRPVAAAGVLSGIATGLKLSSAPAAVGLCVAFLFQPRPRLRASREAIIFGLALLVGVLLSSGAWMWTLYSHFGNPLFPYFNDVFRSAWADAARFTDPRFGPTTLLGWLTFPLPLLGDSTMYVAEPTFRDWRLPLLYFALVAWLVMRLLRRPRETTAAPDSRKWRFVLAFWIVSFLIWAVTFAIYRYIMPLELLAGALLIYFLARTIPREWLPATAAICTALAIFTVRYPAWGRVDYRDHYFTVRMPPVAPNALVLLLDDEPLAFALPFFPADGRFLGANNSFNDPRRQNRLERELERVVREHSGPLYGLSAQPDAGAQTLDAHGLRRAPGECSAIVTNSSPVPFALCRLERTAPKH